MSSVTQKIPSFSAEQGEDAAPRMARSVNDQTQNMPIFPARARRGLNKAVIAVAGVVVFVAAGAGLYFGTDLFRSSEPAPSRIPQASMAKAEVPVEAWPVDDSNVIARVDERAGDPDFTSPLWTKPGDPLPPVAMESPKPLSEARTQPVPKKDPGILARKSASPSVRQPPRAREPATTPDPGSVTSPSASPGTYQTVRPTRVFESPSMSSRVVARIDDGIRLNVVGSTGDWLEVRSRAGNPPGFIRRDDAVRIE